MTSVPCGVWDILMARANFHLLHGRQAGFPGWGTGSEERLVVISHQRRALKMYSGYTARLRSGIRSHWV